MCVHKPFDILKLTKFEIQTLIKDQNSVQFSTFYYTPIRNCHIPQQITEKYTNTKHLY